MSVSIRHIQRNAGIIDASILSVRMRHRRRLPEILGGISTWRLSATGTIQKIEDRWTYYLIQSASISSDTSDIGSDRFDIAIQSATGWLRKPFVDSIPRGRWSSTSLRKRGVTASSSRSHRPEASDRCFTIIFGMVDKRPLINVVAKLSNSVVENREGFLCAFSGEDFSRPSARTSWQEQINDRRSRCGRHDCRDI